MNVLLQSNSSSYRLLKGDGCRFSKHFYGTISCNVKSFFRNDKTFYNDLLALKGVKVEVWERNKVWVSVKLAEGTTDANGNFSAYIDICRAFEGSNVELFLKIKAQNTTYDIKGKSTRFFGSVEYEQTGIGLWAYNGGNGSNVNFGGLTASLESIKATHLAVLAWDFANAKSGSTLATGLLLRTDQDFEGAFTLPNTSCGISFPLLTIILLNKPTIYLPSGYLWTENILYHEFGHFVMWNLQNKCWIDPLSGSFADHGYDKEANTRIAWTEGWADGFMAICDAFYVAKDGEYAIDESHHNLETRNNNTNYPNINNGMLSEFYIACAIFDLWDGADKYTGTPPNYKDIGNWDAGRQDNASLSFQTICQAIRNGDPNGSNGKIESVQGFMEQLFKISNCSNDYQKIKDCFIQNRVVKDIANYLTTGPSTDIIAREQVIPFSGPTLDLGFISFALWAYDFNQKSDVSVLNSPADNYNHAGLTVNENGKLSDNLSVQNGASLYFNKNLPVGFIVDNSPNRPAHNSTFFVDLCGNMTLEAGNNGSISIGDPSINAFAQVRVKTGSTVKLHAGSNLIINNGSTLIIEPGAKIIYEYGAQIQLVGSNSVLEINGTVQIGNGATFAFSGNGFIRWVPITTPNIIAGINSGIYFSSFPVRRKVLEINAPLTAPPNITSFMISTGTVEFGINGSLQLDCPYNFNNADFLGGNIQVGNTASSMINLCNFDGTSIYAEMLPGTLYSGDYYFRMSNSKMKNTLWEALFIREGGMQLANVDFDNVQTAISMVAPNKVSTYNGGNINYGDYGIGSDYGIYTYVAPSGFELMLKKVNINYASIGIHQEGGKLSLKCTKIENGYIGIDLWENASLNMSRETTNGGYNWISNHLFSNIRLNNSDIDMNGGDNYLANGVVYKPASHLIISGTINRSCSLSNILYEKNNQWMNPVSASDPPASKYSIRSSDYPSCSFTIQDGQPGIPAACGTYDILPPPPSPFPSKYPIPLSSCPSCNTINTTSFNNVPYNQAVTTAMSRMELQDTVNGNDSTAIDLFNQILLTRIDSSNPSILYLADIAFSKMNVALNNGFATGRFTAAQNASTLNSSVQKVLQVHNRLSSTSTPVNYNQQFYLGLSKAQMYRTAARRGLALQQVDSLNNCFIGQRELAQIRKWKSLITAEQSILSGAVPLNKFDSLFPVTKPILNITHIDSTATISSQAQLGMGIQIGAGTIIAQNVVIGNNVTIGSGSSILQGTRIGDGTIIGNQTIINQSSVIGQSVIIGNNVSIKQNAIIGDKTQISNNVSLDQNVKIGGLVFIEANTSIKQNVQIADGSYLAGRIVLNQNVSLGSNVILRDSVTFQQGVQIGNNAVVGSRVIINQSAKVGANAVIANGLTIGQNAKVCDAMSATSNLSANGSLGSCTAPSAPSLVGQVQYNCAFALYRAKISGNFFNGFTAQSTDTSKKDFFTNASIGFTPDNLATQYLWNFGDCSTSTSENPTHTYTKPGIYIITLTQTIKCIPNIVSIGAIIVLPQPSSTFQSYPLSCSSPSTILFDINNILPPLNAPSCYSTSGCVSYNTLDSSRFRIKYTFDFNSEFPSFSETYTIKQIATNADSILKRTYAQIGQHTVILTAQLQLKDLRTNLWNNTNSISTSTNTFTTEPLTGTMDFNPMACINQSVSFTGTAATGTPPYTFSWDFGSGNTSIVQNPSATYTASGTFTVTLTVADSRGCQDTAQQIINVNPLPNAKFGFDVCNTSVSFHDSSSDALSYNWDFGDGNTSDVESPTHDYASFGAYSVCLTATNQCGNNTVCQHVVILPQNQWTRKANFGGTARFGVTSFAIGTKGYMGTGWDGTTLSHDFWEYDPQTDTWTQKATFPGIARFVAVGFSFSVGTKGYIGTGWNGSGATDQSDFWEYDQTTNVWTQKASFGGGQRNGAVSFSIGNKGYIGTGWNIVTPPVYYHKDFWEYDPLADTWTRKADFGGPGRQTATGFSIGTKGYIGLGANASTLFQDFWEYDQASDTWTQKANFPAVGRQWATAFSIGTKGYMGTGGTYPNGPFYSDFWAWDQATDVWIQKTDFGGTARSLASGFSIGTKGYLGTGYDGSSQNDFWEFSPDATPCAPAPMLRVMQNRQQPTTTNNATAINNTIAINNGSDMISVYPNPNNGDMTINYFISQNEKSEFAIYDLSGRKLKSYLLTGENSQLNISAKDLQEGVYFYNVISNGTTIKQDKIVVIKQ
ncbi:MAG: PKD domain-containing protein [Bacteroidetes bacterium]|nr:PKD domain-containing protein [Bacteroidota bacterium]